MKSVLTIPVFFLIISSAAFPQSDPVWTNLAGSAMLHNKSYFVLERICDEAGGRLMGTPHNSRALAIMMEELGKIGVHARFEPFTVPGWTRGNDKVEMILPMKRTLRAAALGYVDKTPAFESDVVYASYGFEEDYSNLDAKGKIVLVTQEKPPVKEQLLRYEAIDIAAAKGARAILFIIDKPGGRLLCGVSNFEGKPSAIPAFTLTYEEGMWMQRLLARSQQVRVAIATESFCNIVESRNIVATLPGKSKEKIVIGAHFDSWDIGNGGVDNGHGTAILYDVLRLLKTYTKDNQYTIECVWFNGEELGLWGSRKYVEMHKNDSILAMINMDMTGSPRGFNAMGFDEVIPILKDIATNVSGFELSPEIASHPWTNSDHMYFMFAGIPTISLQAHLDLPMYDYYHDLGDTFDKAGKRYMSEAAAVVSILAYEFANAPRASFHRHNDEEMIALFKKYKLDERLKRQKEWKYE